MEHLNLGLGLKSKLGLEYQNEDESNCNIDYSAASTGNTENENKNKNMVNAYVPPYAIRTLLGTCLSRAACILRINRANVYADTDANADVVNENDNNNYDSSRSAIHTDTDTDTDRDTDVDIDIDNKVAFESIKLAKNLLKYLYKNKLYQNDKAEAQEASEIFYEFENYVKSMDRDVNYDISLGIGKHNNNNNNNNKGNNKIEKVNGSRERGSKIFKIFKKEKENEVKKIYRRRKRDRK